MNYLGMWQVLHGEGCRESRGIPAGSTVPCLMRKAELTLNCLRVIFCHLTGSMKIKLLPDLDSFYCFKWPYEVETEKRKKVRSKTDSETNPKAE